MNKALQHYPADPISIALCESMCESLDLIDDGGTGNRMGVINNDIKSKYDDKIKISNNEDKLKLAFQIDLNEQINLKVQIVDINGNEIYLLNRDNIKGTYTQEIDISKYISG